MASYDLGTKKFEENLIRCVTCEHEGNSDRCNFCLIKNNRRGNLIRWQEKLVEVKLSKTVVRATQTASIKQSIAQELKFANQQFSQFTSAMEGLGVIQEEYDEAMEEIEWVNDLFLSFKKELRNETYINPLCVSELKERIQNSILELIQVSAMFDKFQNLIDDQF